ncbi:fimbrial protein [Pantoea dispersa]|uniref:fimbrial protein n=1 Tax=Pantoea dispersa TaxID=59814 RepID=UPI0021F70023|nr:fimbrial protein [Pantoea dispersa]UYP73321.1 fimbrial protein [Pantoea dispersa]
MMNKNLIIHVLFLCFIYSRHSHAGLDEACWTEPTQKMVINSQDVKFAYRWKGTYYNRSGDAFLPNNYTILCNKSKPTGSSDRYSLLIFEADMGPALSPSGTDKYFKVNDDVDLQVTMVTNYGSARRRLPVKFEDNLTMNIPKLPVGNNLVSSSPDFSSRIGFSFQLRRDILGGAVTIPGNLLIATLYAVDDDFRPRPPRPDKPLAVMMTSPMGIVIPVPIECNINNGNAINVEFGHMVVNSVYDVPANYQYSQHTPLSIKCNSRLNQDAAIQLATGVTDFSSDLIATSNKDLGVAVFHRGQLMKPYQPSLVKLVNGEALETITLSPVKRKGVKVSGGEFTASATVIVTVM